MKPIFSVLMLSVPNRIETPMLPLYTKLLNQLGGAKDVEILCLIDNKVMTIGEKRQKLIDIARGEWLGFLDDDDDVSDTYIADLKNAMVNQPADVICFNQYCIINGGEFHVYFDINHQHDIEGWDPETGKMRDLKRFPYHMCFWRSTIAKTVPMSPVSYGEDFDWCYRMIHSGIKTQTKIDKVLHYYRFETNKSESIKAREEIR